MLQINRLSLTLNKNMRTLVEGFDFSLNQGDRAVIIGEEGNGKSTLLKLIYNESLIEGYASYTGEIYKKGLKLGYLPQELGAEDKSLSIYDFLDGSGVFGLKTAGELASLCSKLGLDLELLYSDRLLTTLSGGEKVKVQLLKILANEPDVLLLDEPSNDIDLSMLKWLESFINSCRQPLIFVSHDETLIENTANVIIHLEQVRRKTVARHTVAKMGYRDYVTRRLNSLEHQEQVARKEKEEYDKQMERWRQLYDRVNRELGAISRQDPHGGRLLKKKMKSVKSQGRRFEREKEDMTQLPDVEEAIFTAFDGGSSVPNSKDILRLELSELRAGERLLAKDIKLTIIGPERVGIVGLNGAGKSTLLKIIAGQLLSRKDINAAYMPQSYEELLDFSLTPVEFLSGNTDKEAVTRARNFLGSLKYTADEMLSTVGELSGGQKAKLLFVKMVLDGANVLLLDEPTRNFSPLSGPVIRKALSGFKGAIISISHDRKYLSEVCTKVYELSSEGLKQVYL